MTKTTEYPLDFAALAKGDYISVGELEKTLCMRADSPRFGFAVMSLIRRIAGRLERDGRTMTLKQERGGIRLLDDAGAAEYNRGRGSSGLRTMIDAHGRNTRVDTRGLDVAQEKAHARTLEIQGKILQAVATTQAQFEPRPVERTTPLLAVVGAKTE